MGVGQVYTRVYSWCWNKISKWYSWSNVSDGQDGGTSIGKRIARLIHAGVQYLPRYLLSKEPEVCESPEQGVDSSSLLNLLKVTPCKDMSLSLETQKCPLLSRAHTIVFSKCDHNGGIITSEVGIKLTICKDSIKEGDVVTFYIAVGFNGPFKFIPSDYGETDLNLSSPYYWIGVSGSYHFHRPIEVEFEHFGACDPSHYQLLCCEDDDESNTMRVVEYELDIAVKDGISLCRFLADHFCS